MNSTRVVKLLCVLVIVVFVAAYASAQTEKPTAKAPQVIRPTATQPAKGASATAPKAYPSCKQGHPGQSERAKDVMLKGDVHMARSVSSHITAYAIQKYQLTGLVQPADIQSAQEDVYEFLKYELGNPVGVAGQFVTAGYQHFDNSYSNEAAAALLGTELPSERDGGHFALTKKQADYLHKNAEAAGDRFDHWLQVECHFSKDQAGQIAYRLTGAANQAIEHIGINIPPKTFKLDSRAVEQLIAEKRAGLQVVGTPAPTRPPIKQ